MEEFLESDFRFHDRIGDPLVHQDMAAMYLSHRRDSGSDRKAKDAKGWQWWYWMFLAGIIKLSIKHFIHQNLNGTLPTDPYITKLRSSYFFMSSGFFGVRGSCGFDFLDLYIKSNEHLPKNAMEAAAWTFFYVCPPGFSRPRQRRPMLQLQLLGKTPWMRGYCVAALILNAFLKWWKLKSK